MKNRLSHTALTMYIEAPKKYFLHYIRKIRPAKTKSAFVFGHALDEAFNSLFMTRDITEAQNIFLHNMKEIVVNGVKVDDVEQSMLVTYTKKDLDSELIEHYGGTLSTNPAWVSLCLKGKLMLDAYNKEVMPNIKSVISVQKRVSLKNEVDDEIYGLLDAIVVWKNNKTYLIDNKTSSVKYDKDSVKESNQLALYHYIEKDNVEIDGCGFIVIDKNINKNRVKICTRCGHSGNGMHKTCDALVGNKRCGGSWTITIHPSVNIEVLFDKIEEEQELRVIGEFDKVNSALQADYYPCGPNGCYSKFGPCVYKKFCETGDMEGLVDLREPDER
jgi:hypothetical protein